MKSLSFYEFTGVLVPGVIFIFGVSVIFPGTKEILFANDVSFGDFGLILVIAYAVGQLIQSIGNLIENIYWKCAGGLPSDWIRQKKSALLSDSQINKLLSNIKAKLNLEVDLAKMSKSEWFNITRQLYNFLFTQNLTSRIDIFNGYYGLNRGLSAVLLALITLGFFNFNLTTQTILAVLFVVALYRMQRFAKHYTRELFLQFINT